MSRALTAARSASCKMPALYLELQRLNQAQRQANRLLAALVAVLAVGVAAAIWFMVQQ